MELIKSADFFLKLAKSYTLSDLFFKKLIKICLKYNINPADVLTVMYSESRVNPGAVNKNGGAVGLIQFMPSTLKFFGASQEEINNFNLKSAEDQLDWVEKFIKSTIAAYGNVFNNAVTFYQSIFFPASIKKGTDLDTVIIDRNNPKQTHIYDVNKGLDMDKDGLIKVNDLKLLLDKHIKSSEFQALLKRLNDAATGENFDKAISTIEKEKPTKENKENVENDNDEYFSLPKAASFKMLKVKYGFKK